MPKCYFCGAETPGKIYRTSLCRACGREMKVCLACEFHDPQAPGACRENQAEAVAEKDRANFCSYFSPSGKTASSRADKNAGLKKQKEIQGSPKQG